MKDLGSEVVSFHCDRGLPVEISLAFAAKDNAAVPLVGILIESSRRRLSRKVIREYVEAWCQWFMPTPTEAKAVEIVKNWRQ